MSTEDSNAGPFSSKTRDHVVHEQRREDFGHRITGCEGAITGWGGGGAIIVGSIHYLRFREFLNA